MIAKRKKKLPLILQDEERVCKTQSFLKRPLSSIYLDTTHVTNCIRPSSSVYAYCKQSNSGYLEGLGMRIRTGNACGIN